MVKTAGVLTSCKRINSKRTTASESLRGKQGRKKAGKEGKYTLGYNQIIFTSGVFDVVFDDTTVQ